MKLPRNQMTLAPQADGYWMGLCIHRYIPIADWRGAIEKLRPDQQEGAREYLRDVWKIAKQVGESRNAPKNPA